MYPKHYQKCCRLCLGTSMKQLEISAVPELPETLKILYKLEINSGDGCSTRICVGCYYEAKVFCNWLRVHRKLKQQFDKNQMIFEEELKRQEVVNISCKICGLNWKTMKLLRKHLKKQHQIPRELLKDVQRVVTATEKEPVRCEICPSVFPEVKTLQYHKVNVHKVGIGQQSKSVPDRQPVRQVFRSRSTRALEIYPFETEPLARITRRSKSISSSVEMPRPGDQPPVLRIRSKSQDLVKLLAEAVTSKSPKKMGQSTKAQSLNVNLSTEQNASDSTSQVHVPEEVVERILPATPPVQSDSAGKPPRIRSLSSSQKEKKRQLRKRAVSTKGL